MLRDRGPLYRGDMSALWLSFILLFDLWSLHHTAGYFPSDVPPPSSVRRNLPFNILEVIVNHYDDWAPFYSC